MHMYMHTCTCGVVSLMFLLQLSGTGQQDLLESVAKATSSLFEMMFQTLKENASACLWTLLEALFSSTGKVGVDMYTDMACAVG